MKTRADIGYDSKSFNLVGKDTPIIFDFIYDSTFNVYDSYLVIDDDLTLNLANRSDNVLVKGLYRFAGTGIKSIIINIFVYIRDNGFDIEYFDMPIISGANIGNEKFVWTIPFLFEKRPLLRCTENNVRYKFSVGVEIYPLGTEAPTLSIEQYSFLGEEIPKSFIVC